MEVHGGRGQWQHAVQLLSLLVAQVFVIEFVVPEVARYMVFLYLRIEVGW